MADSRLSGPKEDIGKTFKRRLRTEWKQKATCGRYYVLVHRLKAWMNQIERGEHLTNAGRLLRAVYHNHPRQQFPPLDAKDISEHLLVFAVLLQNDWGDLIPHFKRANISDNRLSSPSLPSHYPALRYLERDGVAYKDNMQDVFDQDRWEFCPMEIRRDMVKENLDASWVVPFCRRKEVNEKGGTADVFQVLVQEDFIAPDLREVMEQSKLSDPEFGTCYQLALKSYHTEDFYEEETDAFMAVRGQEGMVQCICSYSLIPYAKDGLSRTLQQTHNILLEFGELDLDEFFADSDPPVHPLEIIGFWEKFFKVAEALHKVHYLDRENEDGSIVRLRGWHSDVKPDNILQVHGEFKLADFGFAKFKRFLLNETPMHFIEGGTQAYGSPELDRERRARGTRTPVSQAIDMWSFGCVLSVAVTWVVLGIQGICQYEELRRLAISELRQRCDSSKLISTPEADDCFHDGVRVLPEVSSWLTYLRHGLRNSDFVSGQLLDLISEALLLGDPAKRILSPGLCERLGNILIVARIKFEQQLSSGIVEPISPTIVRILQDNLQGSSETVNTPQEHRVASHPDRETRAPKRIGKSERLEQIPKLKTGHRAVQHRPEKRLLGDSAPFNSAISDKPVIHGSPEGFGEPSEAFSAANGEDSLLPFKPEHGGWTPPLSKRFQPDVIVTSHGQEAQNILLWQKTPPAVSGHFQTLEENDTTTEQLTSITRRENTADLQEHISQSAEEQTDMKELAHDVPAGPQPPSFQRPLVGDLARLQQVFPRTEIFQVRWNLDMQAKQGNVVKSILWRPKKDKFLKGFIKDRDIVLVFDNAISMLPHWEVVTYTAETLTMKVAKLDDDGLDYVFTIGQNHEIQKARSGPSIKKVMVNAAPTQNLSTNMSSTLSKIFDWYLDKQMQRKQTTLLIFTDGVWGGSTEDVETKIQSFAQRIKKRMHERWFSIQFISFGGDQEGLSRLQRLDDEMQERYRIPDMIDTEPWSGSVNKMILGSFEESQFADVQEEPSSGPSSPALIGMAGRPVSQTGTNMTEEKKRKSLFGR